MRVIIAGGRDFGSTEEHRELFTQTIQVAGAGITEVVCGKARGADSLGELWALENGVPVAEFPADWNSLGKRAGYVRNSQMAEYADALLAFWDGQSRGTKHMIDQATAKGLPVQVVHYSGEAK